MYDQKIAKLFTKNSNDFEKKVGKNKPMTWEEAKKKFGPDYFMKKYPSLKRVLSSKDPFEPRRTIAQVLSDDRCLWAIQDKAWIRAYR